MHYDSANTKISANSGVDQGCPLSACGFSTVVDPVLRSVMAQLCTHCDTGAKLFAYLDDWYLWIKPECLLQTIAVITAATRSVNLALRSTQTQVWKGSCQDPIPPEFRDKVRLTLSCLGGHLQIQGDTDPSPVVLGEQATMEKTIQRFQKIATTFADLNAEGLNVQTVNDLLTMYVGAASQHVLRMSFVPEQEAQNFDRQVITYWSRLLHRDIASPLFFLPFKLGGLGVGSAVQRHAAAPWRAWQSIIPTLMATTQSPDTDSLFSSTPQLRAQFAQLQSTFSQQMNKPTFQLKPLGAALRLKTTQKKQVSTIQRNIHKQFYNSLTDTPTEQAILLSQSTSHTGAQVMQPSSEAYEVEDRCFRVSVARRLMLPHPAVADPADVVQFCPNKSAAGVQNVFFVEKGKASRSHEIDDKRLHKEIGSSDRSGKPEKLSEDIRVKHAHDGTGELVKSSASTHIVKEPFVPAEHSDIASFNADNEFNLATDEENIDFNIPGVPNSMVKRSHGVNVHNLIQKIEKPPSATSTLK